MLTTKPNPNVALPELEFLAEDTLISIIPTHRMDTLHFISGSYGPFKPPNRIEVPLWLARLLKKKRRCHIQPPAWLDVTYLQRKYDEEQRQPDRFSGLPFAYMEIAHVLLECAAADDIPQAHTVQRLLQDLREIRQSKARAGLAAVNPIYLQMDNLSAVEINEIRPMFCQAFNQLQRLESQGPEYGGMPNNYESSQPSSSYQY
ncbi:DNA replication protein psf2 [Dimargaris cristalligena]|uniref:DNA replication complex GINS protein PSF2 n=1 Tax=Dimargaris cristalligena TaxID=215637 RepID=A0A4P9ZY71_9FUNG|nr:DNA replication protein psf2 [Dimargaris cristalligena]RKP38318.1 DNA replication complex GINS protein PSF2 [Dimargaris cristalligena]|eukprot:RKP38318.1 DNA replication complex GINS protein PSF2 [Dimargaris cristalligena]